MSDRGIKGGPSWAGPGIFRTGDVVPGKVKQLCRCASSKGPPSGKCPVCGNVIVIYSPPAEKSRK